MKLKKTVYGEPPKTFLAIPDHYVNVTGIIKSNEITNVEVVNVSGTIYEKGTRQIPAGTVVHMDTKGNITAPDNSSKKPNGVIFNTVDIYGEEEDLTATVLVHGFVRPLRLYQPSSVMEDLQEFGTNLIYLME